MSQHWINFCREDFPVPNWDIANQLVGEGYIPFSTEKNNRAGGRHVMDDFGDLVQALPQDHHFGAARHNLWMYAFWGPYGVDDTYFFH